MVLFQQESLLLKKIAQDKTTAGYGLLRNYCKKHNNHYKIESSRKHPSYIIKHTNTASLTTAREPKRPNRRNLLITVNLYDV